MAKTSTRKRGLVRRVQDAAGGGFTVEDFKASRHTWGFRIRQRGRGRKVVYRLFVTDEVHSLIREGNYEQWKKGFIADWQATLWANPDAA